MFSRLLSLLKAWTRRDRFEDVLDEEVRFHLEACTEDLVRAGLPRREAARRARVRFGSIEGAKDDCRRARGLRLADELDQTMTNVRVGFRMLFRTPVVTCVAVLSLALGIGPNAAIFSVFNQVLLRPLPVVEPEGLVNLEAPPPKPGSTTVGPAGGFDGIFSYPMFRDLQRGQDVFTDIAAHRNFGVHVGYGGRTIEGQGLLVSGSYFPVLGLAPAAGRLPGPEVDAPIGAHPIAVLSHAFWQAELGGEPGVIGDALVVNGQPLTIVGVAPAGFEGTTFGLRPLIFVPIAMRGVLSPGDGGFENRRSYWAYLFARLEPDVSMVQARAALSPLYRSILTEVEAPLHRGFSDRRLAEFVAKPILISDGRRGQSSLDEQITPSLLLLFAVTGIVVLIACANVANLLLARLSARASEMAVRLSIGATRRHLIVQLLTESCLLAFLGGAVGLVVGHWTLRALGPFLPAVALGMPSTMEPAVVLFAGALSLGTGILFGIYPALRTTRVELVESLKDDAGQPAGARAAVRFRDGLVTAQFALAMTLLVAAGLFIQSLRNVNRVDLGIRTDNVVAFRLSPELGGYTPRQAQALFERVQDRLAAQPGVTGVSAALVGLFTDNSWGSNVMVEGFEPESETAPFTYYNAVAPGFFRTLGMPLLAGRTFTASDADGAPRVAIVNEAFVRMLGLGRDVVGRRMGQGGRGTELDMEIVGVVADAGYDNVKSQDQPIHYLPSRQRAGLGRLTFYVRTARPPDGFLRMIPALMAELDPNLPVTRLTTLPSQVRDNVSGDRMISLLSLAFAGLATLLAATGLYGVLAYAVAQRTREIGLRMALGADAARLRAMVLGQVGRMTLAGGAVGLAAALGLARAAQSLLYEVDGLPAAVIAAAALALALVALAAGLVPAHRAARIDPMEALRHR
ncbi:MAG: ABC transporter permease [Acidobacteria bacterium]|nr:ABC transporter permease [Acidobacteriota bacterium]